MSGRFRYWFCACLMACLMICAEAAQAQRGTGWWDPADPFEPSLLRDLGLPPDANDAQIVRCLDAPEKVIFAASLVRSRRMTSATPKLVQIVNDPQIHAFGRISAAKALCDFGNRDWLRPVKALSADPNSGLDVSTKISVAGLLARAGDFSQFQFVVSYVADDKDWMRYAVVAALGEFADKSNPVGVDAANILSFVATSDKMPSLRRRSIESLQKIVQKRADLKPVLVAAARANADANDSMLRTTSRSVLRLDEKSKEPPSATPAPSEQKPK